MPRSVVQQTCCYTSRNCSPGRLHIPTVDDWIRINKRVPRLVSVLPNGPVYHPTVNAFMAGGVPEVMLHLRSLGLLHEDVMTVTGRHAERKPRLVGALRTASAVQATPARSGTNQR
mgnify:CR=1 FL=1